MSVPLAERLRPQTFDEMMGQRHLLDPDRTLRRTIDSGGIPNMIFYGPPGVGKTTVAPIIARRTRWRLVKMNDTTASTANTRAVVESPDTLKTLNGVLLYLDEIQYFNKRRQQTLLELIENGQITLTTPTTENPYFYVYNVILSRSTVFEFKVVNTGDILRAVERAFALLEQKRGETITRAEEVDLHTVQLCEGDMRRAMNAVELCTLSARREADGLLVELEAARELTQKSAVRYDKDGDEHYDLLSAFRKSMRGSDPNVAVHYLTKLLEVGDLPSVCRRLLVCASEDVGLAWPRIIPITKTAVGAALQVGLSEARIPLANTMILVCMAPKSNLAYLAVDTVLTDIRADKSGSIPHRLQNKHFDGADQAKKGQFYLYPHDYPDHWVVQQYLPDLLSGAEYYTLGLNKNEQTFLQYWKKIMEKEQK